MACGVNGAGGAISGFLNMPRPFTASSADGNAEGGFQPLLSRRCQPEPRGVDPFLEIFPRLATAGSFALGGQERRAADRCALSRDALDARQLPARFLEPEGCCRMGRMFQSGFII